ncbi:hypothetical protein I6I28_08875 [Staphylococcus pettenkoferi]|uniref:hypothetical protein n=1 Tax=Staphylococcus pettenkoferi TaxID=170573 RepID=UPI000CD23EEE|nr:hypothetical protein [Staphylococcus pettenkoferi]MCY1585611.1 hypothetical protein [Staphylococcus pettenkoferi]PNZ87668.1 hypothetical protein CD126_08970 [Staphylococcus pettenkoferi]QQC36821.1 hypothetical protein I6I28_08875 [Staphylococcus pettenkoferi]
MKINELQETLRRMYKEYEREPLIQMRIIDWGKTINRLLDEKRLNIFDDFEENKDFIFDEMEAFKHARRE